MSVQITVPIIVTAIDSGQWTCSTYTANAATISEAQAWLNSNAANDTKYTYRKGSTGGANQNWASVLIQPDFSGYPGVTAGCTIVGVQVNQTASVGSTSMTGSYLNRLYYDGSNYVTDHSFSTNSYTDVTFNEGGSTDLWGATTIQPLNFAIGLFAHCNTGTNGYSYDTAYQYVTITVWYNPPATTTSTSSTSSSTSTSYSTSSTSSSTSFSTSSTSSSTSLSTSSTSQSTSTSLSTSSTSSSTSISSSTSTSSTSTSTTLSLTTSTSSTSQSTSTSSTSNSTSLSTSISSTSQSTSLSSSTSYTSSSTSVSFTTSTSSTSNSTSSTTTVLEQYYEYRRGYGFKQHPKHYEDHGYAIPVD